VEYIEPPLDLTVEEIEVPSYDGVKVPLSIIYKKGIKLDGKNPTLIDAYGAYGISMKPYFNRNRLMWFKNGGIYAMAHVRGGGEKGDNWYKGGFKSTKSNCWKDLIACSEYLIKNKYTSSQNIAVTGSSAGGITVGRAITERPELFKVAVIYVGLLNTVRIENTSNLSVAAEFGTVKDSLEFKYLLDMDTYHHIHKGVNYPSILFTAGLNDFRVPVWQIAKAAAKMQEVSKGENLILLRIEDKGHFNYPSEADVYSFLFWQLGHPDFKWKTTQSFKKEQ
jgi:prolyl oligopeptidase